MATIKCSFSGLGKSSCGDFRCSTYTVCRLRECQENITNHLKACRLSKLSGMVEYGLILIRAGLFDVPPHRQEEMFACPKHRHNLGRNWRPLRTCRYPLHSGARKKLKKLSCYQLENVKEYSLKFLESQFPLVLACSRLRDGGGKSFSKKKCEKRAEAGERHRPLSQVVRVLFSLCSF